MVLLGLAAAAGATGAAADPAAGAAPAADAGADELAPAIAAAADKPELGDAAAAAAAGAAGVIGAGMPAVGAGPVDGVTVAYGPVGHGVVRVTDAGPPVEVQTWHGTTVVWKPEGIIVGCGVSEHGHGAVMVYVAGTSPVLHIES